MKISFSLRYVVPFMTVCPLITRASHSATEKLAKKLHKKQKHYTVEHSQRIPIRNRMLSVSKYSNDCQKMESMNDSVIICDTLTPKPKGTAQQNNGKVKKTKCKRILGEANDELSKVQTRLPLRTVYESPLNHHTRNTCKTDSSMVINLAAKRFKNNQNNDNPPAKKRKINKLDETIVILSDDDEPKPSISPRTSGIVLVDLDNTVSEAIPKNSPSMRKKRRSLRIHKQMIAKNATKTESNKGDEDIAVVWSSTNGETNDRMNVGVKSVDPNRELFFVDTHGDQSNHLKQSLQPAEIPRPLVSTSEHQKSVTTKKKLKAKRKSKGKLREIIVDGCNVAIGYSHSNVFCKQGLELVYNYFRERGHIVKIFLPQHQRKKGREYLETWYRQGNVIFTPSRQIGGKNIVSYDDRFIVEYATKCGGIIVTSDQYRDLWAEKPEWRETIEKRLLIPTFVGDYVMFPEDPLGRNGPKLDQFLRY